VGDAEADRAGLGEAVKCASPFLASSGAVCGVTRPQLARLCVSALLDGGGFSKQAGEQKQKVTSCE